MELEKELREMRGKIEGLKKRNQPPQSTLSLPLHTSSAHNMTPSPPLEKKPLPKWRLIERRERRSPPSDPRFKESPSG
jgi:hypothetical protein